MKVAFELKTEDYINFNIYHMRHSQLGRSNLLRFRLMLFVFHMLTAILIVELIGIPRYIGYPAFFAVYLFQLGMSRKNYEKYNLNRIRKLLSSGQLDNIFGEYVFEFKDDGLYEKSSGSERKTMWEDVYMIRNHASYIFIYSDSSNAYIIPKRAFIDNEETEKCVEYVYEKL